MPYKIIVDTREQYPLEFGKYKDCEGSISRALKVGDYAIEGMEDLICIERKASTIEIARNLGVDQVRFYKELNKMKDFKYKYIVCEFSMEEMIEYPNNSGIPKYALEKLKFDGKFLLKKMLEITMDYDIQIIYAGNKYNSYLIVGSILRRMWLKHGQP